MADFWNNQQEIVTVEKNKKETIKVSLCERQDKEYIELRIYAEDRPTKKGIVIPKEMWNTISTEVNKIN